MRSWGAGLALLAAALPPAAAAWSAVRPARPATDVAGAFRSTLLPLLRARCFGCHGDGRTESGLDLRTRAALLKGGKRGPALVPGKSGKSLLLLSLRGHGGLAMPPARSQRLSSAQIETVRRWIDAGAPWPDAAAAARAEPKAGDPGSHWAFQPVTRPPLPATPAGGSAAHHPVDAFVLAKLRSTGAKTAGPADRVTLLRRATYDLHGLPPTPEEVDAFTRDPRQTKAAFAAVVERLLASPRYGERWGRHWLDVVRYADTGGGSNDFERPNAWRYRDYVVRSFNQDKPYDRFILEQLAGDELEPASPECLVATGFLRMGPWEHTGMSVEAVTRQQWLDDVTHSTATAFMGLTAGCARCHDHKFDPLSTKEYYSLQAVFAGTRFSERPAAWLPGEYRPEFERDAARVREKVRRLQERLKGMGEISRAALARERGVKSADELPKADVDRAVRSLLGFQSADLERERIYRKWTQLYQATLPRYQPVAFSVRNDPGPAPELSVLVGGQLASPGEKVAPGIFGAVHAGSGLPEPSFPDAADGRRLALARWIASRHHPLTARVMVNRVWQWHFGRGLVETSNNFGKMGKKPSHPELLDWLAVYFTEHGWSLKALHRLLMASDAYQRSSRAPSPESVKADPEARLLTCFPPRRLEAEELRDTLLAVAGELSPSTGGPGTFPEINEDLARQARHVMGTIAPAWEPSPTRAERNRRTLYCYQQRSMPDPLVETFNGANPNDSCERRLESTVAPQVFNLFNSRFSHDAALAFARRLERETGDRGGQVERAFRLALQRAPTPDERAAVLAHLAEMEQHHRQVLPEPAKPPGKLVRSAVVEQTGEVVRIEEETDPAAYERNLHPSEVSPEIRALAELCLVLLNSSELIYLY